MKFEIGRILHCESEIRKLKSDSALSSAFVQFEISVFGLEMQDSSDFRIFRL